MKRSPVAGEVLSTIARVLTGKPTGRSIATISAAEGGGTYSVLLTGATVEIRGAIDLRKTAKYGYGQAVKVSIDAGGQAYIHGTQ